MFPILFRLGPLTLHTYGLMVALGFLAGYFLARKRFEKNGIPLVLLDRLVLMVMIGGILGARIFYFVLEDPGALRADPFAFFRIWEGGLVFLGAFVGGFIALAAMAYTSEVSFLKIVDSISAPLLLGQALGRVGCFTAGCCYGKETTVFWGVTFKNLNSLAPLGIRLHPTQLYEALGDVLLFFGVRWLEKWEVKRGVLFSFYLVGYGVCRYTGEIFRNDFRGPDVLGLSPSQIGSLILIGSGLFLFLYAQNSSKLSS